MTQPLTPDAAADLFRSPPDRFLDVGSGEVVISDVLYRIGYPLAVYSHNGNLIRPSQLRRGQSCRPRTNGGCQLL